MTTNVFSPEDLAPAHIRWDKLILDPERPLEPQIDDTYDELLLAEFPNGVLLDIEWRDEHRFQGFFVVTLVQNPDRWEPIANQRCDTLDELKRTVAEFVGTARGVKKRYLLDREQMGADEVWLNRLALQPDVPMVEQLDLLSSELFEASYMIGGRVLTIGWLPPHDASGEFIIRMYRSQTEWRSEGIGRVRERDPKSWQLISEKRCGSVSQLVAMATEMGKDAGSPRLG